MRWLHRPRRLIAIMLIAALLVTQPAKPAHAFAFAVIAAAATYVASQLTGIFGAEGKLRGVLLAIETQLPILLTTVELKVTENIAKAQAAAHQQMLDRMAKRKTLEAHPTDITQANCQAITGLADANNLEMRSTTVYTPLTDLHHDLQNPGTPPFSAKRNASGSTDSNRQVIYEYGAHCKNYATENDLAAAIKNGCTKPDGTPIKTLDDIKSNPYKGADTDATSLLTDAYYEPRAFKAAYDYCMAMTGNLPLNNAQGRSLSENIDNIQQFLVALSDKAAHDLSYHTCEAVLRRRMPIDNVFAIKDPQLTATLTKLGASSATTARAPSDIDKASRTYLTDAGYQTLQPDAAKALENKLKLATGTDQPTPITPYVIDGQTISHKQNNEAIYLDQYMSAKFTSTGMGNSAAKTEQLLWSKVANMQMMWLQYKKLEEQTLNEAVQLARLVRSAPAYGNPPTSAPSR